jgi:hypothetical protein
MNTSLLSAITGHSLRDVRSILDANYLHRDPALGESAIRKLERGVERLNKENTPHRHGPDGERVHVLIGREP